MPDIDVEKLRQMTQNVRERNEESGRKLQAEMEAKEQAAAKEVADVIIQELPAKIEAAAAKGGGALTVISEGWNPFTRHQERVAGIISSWAREQGLETWNSYQPPYGSDDYSRGSQSFGVIWEKDPKTRRYY